MPSFEYKGNNASGESSSGIIDASSRAAAQATLKSRGVTVVLLRPAGSGPQMQAPNAFGSQQVPKVGPPAGSFAIPPSVSSPQSASPPVAPAAWAHRPSGRGPGRVRIVLMLVAFSAVVAAAAAGYALTEPQGDVRLQKGETARVLSFKGKITFSTLPKSADPWRNMHVSFVLPEVPTEATLGRTELAFNAVGDFTVKVHFLSAVTPHILNVRVACRGYQGESMDNLKIVDDLSHPTSIPPMILEQRAVAPPETTAPAPVPPQTPGAQRPVRK